MNRFFSEPLRFLIPGDLPVPSPVRAEAALLQDGFVRWGTRDPDNPKYVSLLEPRPLPHEFVFRELWDLDSPPDWRCLDATAAESLLRFASEHGVLWRPHPAVTAESMPEAANSALWSQRTKLTGLGLPINHLADVVRWTADLQRMTRHLVAVVDDEYTGEIWGHRPSPQTDGGLPASAVEQIAHAEFLLALDRGLRQHTDGVVSHVPAATDGDRSRSFDLYGASCMMLRSIILEDARVSMKRCGNDRCNRPFLRQLPETASSGETRKKRSVGVRYCSNKCKNNAAKRREYHRKAAGQQSPSPADGATTNRSAEQTRSTESEDTP
jgi:hypothetical protein